ncbi:6-phosphofructokinase [Niabella drilacis]|uniref:6-phosphofructokinase 1 n=1 Tax=Niabella drilacis (strain DSM 25811 / CCM 8410 / CCUG 62505 / LMG 26954 / E90) TaxID=1285928 RepID=A0A1G6Y7K0_NIADE|nr:6-phosphofructokinase [Niabella drilacis]SDD86378.1 6-phosphofructokinase 1 [Niabella drilacis]
MEKSIVILAGGGPAPGINTVIGSVAKSFLKDGYRVIGLHDGYKNLFNGNGLTTDIDFKLADDIFSRGGSFLRMSRYKPKDDEFTSEFFEKNNIQLLVTIGGDDTASTANRIATFLRNKNVPVQNIHVPKTIDNDLPLPYGQPTFGYQSAREEGVKLGKTIYEDARTSGNWFVVSAMGREAGHLAFGIGVACHYPMIVIPEMFNKTKLTLDKITRLIVSSIVKRNILEIPYGVAVVSEGVFHFMSDDDIKASGIQFTYDDHGHPELGNVSKAHIYNILLQNELKKLNIPVKSRPVELGYELRCLAPTAYDLEYCTFLGMGVKKLFDQGITGAVVTADATGNINPLYLKDVADEKGKVKPRLIDMQSADAQTVFAHALHYLTEADRDAAKKYLENPEEYLFNNILEWN